MDKKNCDIYCENHKNKEISLFCEKEKKWFCDACIGKHRQCGFPTHFTEIIENHKNDPNQKSLSLNNKNISDLLDVVIANKQIIDNTFDELTGKIKLINEYSDKSDFPEGSILEALQILEIKSSSDVIAIACDNLIKTISNAAESIKQKSYSMKVYQNEGDLIQEKDYPLLFKWLGCEVKLKLLFKASMEEFSADRFHEKCSGISPTLVVAKTNYDKIIGGVSFVNWMKANGEYEYGNDLSKKGFLFSLTNKSKYDLKTAAYSICNSPSSGPKFGGGHDLEIVNSCNIKYNAYSGIGHTYEYSGKSEDFYGSPKYLITEYEVYQIFLTKN